MARKFLDDLGVDYLAKDDSFGDEREAEWAAEREIFGFDMRDTWSLDVVMLQLLFERVSAYLQVAPEMIEVDYELFEFEGVKYTQREAIEKLLADLRIVLTGFFAGSSDPNVPTVANTMEELSIIVEAERSHEELIETLASKIWRFWAVLAPSMWW